MRLTLLKRGFALGCSGILAASMLFMGVGCAKSEQGTGQKAASEDAATQQATGATFTDDMGNEVKVTTHDRVVACMGSFANTWELAGGTLVGASDDAFDSYDMQSKNVQKVGDFSNPNLEAIIALEPDFVIMTGGTGGRGGNSSQTDLKAALDASGIPVAYFEVTTFPDYMRMLRTCCDITGRDDLYQQNGQTVADEIEAVKAKVPADKAPTALLMTTYSGGTRVQSSSSMTGAMLAELGVKNLADENKSLLKDFSLESIIEMNPDFIFVVPMGNDDAAALKNLEAATAANPAWSTLTAVQSGNYLTLSKELFLYKPDNQWAESYRTLFDDLYA